MMSDAGKHEADRNAHWDAAIVKYGTVSEQVTWKSCADYIASVSLVPQ